MHTLITAFAKHRVAPNALMFIVIFLGLLGLDRLNTQFLPDFDLNSVIVSTPWEGASAEDVQDGLAIPIEQAILSLTDVDRVTTTSIEGRASMTVTLKDSAPPVDQMVTEIEKAIEVLNLPDGVDDTIVEEVVFFDPVADVLIYGDLSIEELEKLADDAERSLKAAGIAKVDIEGLPTKEFAASVPLETYLDTNQSLSAMGSQLAQRNLNAPAGIAGENSVSSQLRIRNEAQTVESIGSQILSFDDQLLAIDQIANVEANYDDSEKRVFYQGQPAVKLVLSRATGDDTLEMAEILAAWTEQHEALLPEGAQIYVYNEAYEFVQSRVSIILENGLGGMVLVLIVLFIFLNHRLAWWVAVGVPISFLATFVFLELTGNSINVISLLGFLIALGVIVDDAIVVGENAYANMEQGDDPQSAAIKAAKRMLPAVTASSVTTVAAFLPLLLVTGQAGAFVISVPIVVIMAILASLIECFLILPGHLAHSFKEGQQRKTNRFRQGFERGFDFVRQKIVRRIVTFAVEYRATTFSFVVMALVLAILLVASGRVRFVFFPAIQQPEVELRAEFAEGTSQYVINEFLDDMEAALYVVEDESGEQFVNTVVRETNDGSPESAGMFIELNADTNRKITNADIIRQWRAKVASPPGLVQLNFVEGQQGPSSNGVSVRLINEDLAQLQAATEMFKAELAELGGLVEIEDDIPLGSEQLDLTLTPDANALGLTPSELARTLREIADGYNVQSLQVDGDELDVLLAIEDTDVDTWFALSQLPVPIGNGEARPLSALATPEYSRAIEQLSRVDGELSAVVTAKLESRRLNLTEVNQTIDSELRPKLLADYPNVRLEIEGDQEGQNNFFADVRIGGLLGLLIIFIALAWVFESWLWPFAVMSAIPFALTGAIVGHWVLGLSLSVLSIYGLFGLSGIIINDSIVLVSFYRELRKKGMAIKEAVIEASVQRFRAVLLTTLTTVGGLTPLMFETSFDAQFLIPLAAGIAFGLMYGIVLILFFVPAVLVSIEVWTERFKKLGSKNSQQQTAAPAG